MERMNDKERKVIPHLEGAVLEQEAASLGARLSGQFADMGRMWSSRLAEGISSRAVFAAWEAQASRLRRQFDALGDAVGQSVIAAMTPAVRALNRFMGALVKAANTFKAFVFSLMGKKSADMAAGEAAALEEIGDSAAGTGRKVGRAARELRRSLMAFDEINRLNEETGGGSGGGGSGGLGDTASALIGEDYDVSGNLFGEMLRELIDDRKFFEAGELLALKFGEMVDRLDERLTAPEFQDKLMGALRGITEGINGFFAGLTLTPEGRQSAAGRFGDLIGDIVGTGLESAHVLLSELDWGSMGTVLAQFINGGIASLRDKPSSAGTVIADWVNSRIGSLSGLFSELDWDEIGGYIADNINDVFLNIDWAAAADAFAEGVRGLGTLIGTALQNIQWAEIVSDVSEALFRAVFGEKGEQWLREHPFWSKLLFGSDTPYLSAGAETVPVTAEIVGWKDSLQSKWLSFGANLTTWWDSLKNKWTSFGATMTSWKDSLKNKWVAFGASLTTWADNLKNKWASFGAKLTTWWDALKSKWLNFGAKLTTWWDSIKANAYGVKGWLNLGANLTAWWDSIKANAYGVKGWLSFGANLTTWWDSLKNKVLNFGAKLISWSKATGGVYAGGAWRPIQAYAGGGMPGGGQLFVAREAGPELVGTLGGHTAVMNNDQIVASVSAGVARAIAGIRFYSQDRATPHLAMVGASVSRSEEHLATLARQAADEASRGGTARVIELLLQILAALQSADRDVYLDGESVKDKIVALINKNTRATGVCEILV